VAETGGDAAFWEARAEQLQVALSSRIVIEQAKGVVAERYACDVDDAFELLRRSARDSRRPLHDVAAEVVASAGTTSEARDVAAR